MMKASKPSHHPETVNSSFSYVDENSSIVVNDHELGRYIEKETQQKAIDAADTQRLDVKPSLSIADALRNYNAKLQSGGVTVRIAF